jgi:hypothetical protein
MQGRDSRKILPLVVECGAKNAKNRAIREKIAQIPAKKTSIFTHARARLHTRCRAKRQKRHCRLRLKVILNQRLASVERIALFHVEQNWNKLLSIRNFHFMDQASHFRGRRRGLCKKKRGVAGGAPLS